MADVSVAILGAGPYGLATANYLRSAGIETRVFGEPMHSWLTHMPAGMLLRSRHRSSHIAAPDRALSIYDWAAETGASPAEPLPLEDFYAYGRWYQERAVPDVENRRVEEISMEPEGFALSFAQGETLSAKRVVVAAGIAPFAYMPETFRELPDRLVSHSAHHSDLGVFSGLGVMVLGAGQSALESAALLHEAGAKPTIVARTPRLRWLPPHVQPELGARLHDAMLPPTDVGGTVTGWLAATPGGCRRLPADTRAWVLARCTAPIGADWLRSRLEDVPAELGRTLAAVAAADGRIAVTLDDGRRLDFDHVLLCTGYKVDIHRYGFLSPDLVARLELDDGSPRLGPGLESSLPGLHFAGAPAAASFGPIMRFVVGTWYAAPAIARRITGRKQHPAHLAYRPRVGKGASRSAKRDYAGAGA
jgi:thioredoxin reductase